jgi:outer membrane protein OmpA-like peptidoglycan-associated protein
MRTLACLLLAFLLSACASGPLEQLTDQAPSSDNYPSALAAEYLGYAKSESEQGHGAAANYYATKGLKALDGEKVEPEPLSPKIPTGEQRALTSGRAHLLQFSNDDMKSVAPQKLARAQLLFDCWQEQLIHHVKPELALCDDGFSSAMTELQDVADAFEYSNESIVAVTFAPKMTTLDDDARAAIKDVVGRLTTTPYYRIELQSYSGIRVSQRNLTRARLAAVRQALIDGGVPKENISIRKFGSVKAVSLSEDKLAPDTKKIYITIKIHAPVKPAVEGTKGN